MAKVAPKKRTGNGESSDSAGDFTPSDEAIVAARIVDGEARTSWEMVSEATTDADLEAASELVQTVVAACVAGDTETLARLRQATEVLAGHPATEGQRMVRLVSLLERWSAFLHLQRQHDRSWTFGDPRPLVNLDPAFAGLSGARLSEVLAEIEPDASGRGGAGRRSAVYYAAILALEVNAFGFADGTVSFEEKLTRAVARLKVERSRLRKGLRAT